MRYYNLKYRLGMEHSFDGNDANRHHHVIELKMIARPLEDQFVEFGSMEKMISEVLDPYQKKYLNLLPEFSGNTSIENIGEVLFKKLDERFLLEKWKIARFEISETPLRVYAIVSEEY